MKERGKEGEGRELREGRKREGIGLLNQGPSEPCYATVRTLLLAKPIIN